MPDTASLVTRTSRKGSFLSSSSSGTSIMSLTTQSMWRQEALYSSDLCLLIVHLIHTAHNIYSLYRCKWLSVCAIFSVAWRRLSEYNRNIANNILPNTVKSPRAEHRIMIHHLPHMYHGFLLQWSYHLHLWRKSITITTLYLHISLWKICKHEARFEISWKNSLLMTILYPMQLSSHPHWQQR